MRNFTNKNGKKTKTIYQGESVYCQLNTCPNRGKAQETLYDKEIGTKFITRIINHQSVREPISNNIKVCKDCKE